MANASGHNEAAPLNQQLVRQMGLDYCRERLSSLGWNITAVARNVRVDFIARSRDASRSVEIKVRTLSKQPPVPLGPTLDKIGGDFWVIVNNVATPSSSFFVLLPSEVRKLAHRGEKDGRVTYWLQPGDYEPFREKWERIGRGDA